MKKSKVYKYELRDQEGVRDTHKPMKFDLEAHQKVLDSMLEIQAKENRRFNTWIFYPPGSLPKFE